MWERGESTPVTGEERFDGCSEWNVNAPNASKRHEPTEQRDHALELGSTRNSHEQIRVRLDVESICCRTLKSKVKVIRYQHIRAISRKMRRRTNANGRGQREQRSREIGEAPRTLTTSERAKGFSCFACRVMSPKSKAWKSSKDSGKMGPGKANEALGAVWSGAMGGNWQAREGREG